MFDTAHAAEKLQDFLRAQDNGEFLRFLRRGDDILESQSFFSETL